MALQDRKDQRWHLTQHVQCPSCSRLLSSLEGDFSNSELPCPRCGGANESRQLWPNAKAAAYIIFAREHPADAEGLRTMALLVAAGCESLLRDILVETLARRETERRVAGTFISHAKGREAMLRAFYGLTGAKCSKVLKDEGLHDWWGAWGGLTAHRNSFAHGEWSPSLRVVSPPPPLDKQLVSTVRQGALQAFAALHNAAVDSDAS